jgi:hypothetical protein
MMNLIPKILIIGLCLAGCSHQLHAKSYPLKIEIPQSVDPLKVSAQDLYLESQWMEPYLNLPPLTPSFWKHTHRSQKIKVLVGMVGEQIADTFHSQGVYLIREIWISNTKNLLAIRQRLINKTGKNLYLKSLFPMKCESPAGLLLARDPDVTHWEVLLQHRLKNGRPQTIQPPGEGYYEIDQFAIFHHQKIATTPLLFVGYLSQTGHNARILLEFQNRHSIVQLTQFTAECEFDSCLVPPGGEKTSQWIYIELGDDPNDLISDYADRVGIYHGVSRPLPNAPSVFCSWYFHGYYYNEEYFHRDLEALKKDYMPFDVFLIDECWSLNKWGDFEAINSWPSGMKDAADRIRALGYTPGIWSCPYLVDFESNLAQNFPEWLLKDVTGKRVTFKMNNIDHWVLDPTFPGVTEFLEETYRKLANDWGYQYFKFDFMRAVFLPAEQRFFDSTSTRLEAYRRGLEAIRRGTGPDAYLAVCGGHYGGSLGIANSQRSGSDVVSIWREREIPKFRQNILRTWMSRLWHVDPDAMMVRKRTEKFHDSELSLGLLTDSEAQTIALNQYVAGGLITFSEYLPELGEERKKLYRHIIPSINSSSIPLDIFDPLCPSQMLTVINPLCSGLNHWITVSVINWTDQKKEFSLALNDQITKFISAKNFLVFEFFEQKVMGIYNTGELINLGTVSPHSSRLLKISPWDSTKGNLAGTNLHFSGGGVEISDWLASQKEVQGEIRTAWKYPVTITAVFPSFSEKGFVVNSITIQSGQKKFRIENPEDNY